MDRNGQKKDTTGIINKKDIQEQKMEIMDKN